MIYGQAFGNREKEPWILAPLSRLFRIRNLIGHHLSCRSTFNRVGKMLGVMLLWCKICLRFWKAIFKSTVEFYLVRSVRFLKFVKKCGKKAEKLMGVGRGFGESFTCIYLPG